MSYSIAQMPAHDRPRERLQLLGPDALSTSELLAILWGSGTRGKSVLALAQEVLVKHPHPAEATLAELCEIDGLGPAKALQLHAALALSSRLSVSDNIRPTITRPEAAYALVRDRLAGAAQEHFLVLLLDAKCRLITIETVAIGTLTEALIHPREVLRPAVRHKAAGFLLVHNHPSGDPTPSPEDEEATRTLSQAAELLEIEFHDHLITGNNSFKSLRLIGFLSN
jgi:DNA repair protein RadC